MAHPNAIRNDKPTYDDQARARYEICFHTKERVPGKEGEVDSAHIPILGLYANRAEIRWGIHSAWWLRFRQASAGGWIPFDKVVNPDPKAAKRRQYLRGQQQRGMYNEKEKLSNEHFVQYSSEEGIPQWDAINGLFNIHPVFGTAEPIGPANCWALRGLVDMLRVNGILNGGQFEKHPLRTIWVYGPNEGVDGEVTEDGSDPQADRTYEKNRELLYNLSSSKGPDGKERTGRLVYWEIR